MEANLLEDSLKKDVRFKELVKRSKIFWKRLDRGTKNKEALIKRMRSMGKQKIDSLPEIHNLTHSSFEIELSLSLDRYNSLMEGITFESEELDGLPSTAIDKYIARQESVVTRWEESMDKAEAAQVRIKELLDSLG